MSGHTPGPWEIHRTEDVTGMECQELTALNGRLTGMALIYSDEDANLIAAAPDLLEALQGARKIIAEAARDYQDNRDLMYGSIAILPKIDAAISRAKGEA